MSEYGLRLIHRGIDLRSFIVHTAQCAELFKLMPFKTVIAFSIEGITYEATLSLVSLRLVYFPVFAYGERTEIYVN